MYVLDTTALSALMNAEPGHVERMMATNPGDVVLPQPALAEIRYGLERLGRSRRRTMLEEKLKLFLADIARTFWDDRVSKEFGTLKARLERQGRRLEDLDLTIAAHALAYEATLVTGNVKHFKRITGLKIEDWRAP